MPATSPVVAASTALRTWQSRVSPHESSLLQLAGLTLAAFAAGAVLSPSHFLTLPNFQSMAFQIPELALLALAMFLVFLPGGIDLSIVATANLSGVVTALLMVHPSAGSMPSDSAPLLAGAIASGLACGAACGALNGFLIGFVRIPPILASLGSMYLFLGSAMVITQGRAIDGLPERFLVFGNGTCGGIPLPLLLWAAVALAVAVLTSRTSFGFRLRLVGVNRRAAYYSGIRPGMVFFQAHLCTGLIAGLTGVLMAARTGSAKADYGASYLLQSILVAVLGGVRPTGGFGRVVGLCLSVCALQFIASTFNILRFSNFSKEFAWGLFLIAAMVINHWATAWRRKTVPVSPPAPTDPLSLPQHEKIPESA